MRIETLKALLGGLLLSCAAGTHAQTLQDLRATTIEAAPAAQVAAAEATLKQLRDALASCDGARLYALLPEWELQILPALAFDALHASEDGLIAGLGLQQAALSAYGRAAISLRAKASDGRTIEPVQVLTDWCEANKGLIQALYGDLASRAWQWLRQDELQLLSGCAVRPVGDGRLSLLWLDGRWQFALLESVETLLLEAFGGANGALRETLLAQRKDFLDQYPALPPAPRPADRAGRERLLLIEPPAELDRYASLIEQRKALPPCR